MGDNWDPQKMLEMYIHDYMVKKDMRLTAEIFALEADIRPKSVLINSPDGFLTEWWSLFWDFYCSRLAKNTQATQASTSKDTNNARPSGPHPMADIGNFMLQNMSPATLPSGISNLLQNVGPTITPSRDEGSYLLSTMVPNIDFNQNPFGPNPISDSIIGQHQTIANLMAPGMREPEPPKLPNVYSDTNVIDVDQLACSLPSSSRLSNPQKPNKKRPLAVTKDEMIGSRLSGITSSEPIPIPPPIFTQHNMEPPPAPQDTGSSASSNSACSDK